MKEKRLHFYLLPAAVICTLFLIGCFSPWKGDEGIFSVTVGGDGNGLAGARALTEKAVSLFSHTIKLTGPGPDQTITVAGNKTVQFSVTPGNWTISVKAYLSGELIAEGSVSRDIKPGLNGAVTIEMHPSDDGVNFDSLFIVTNDKDDIEMMLEGSLRWAIDMTYDCGGGMIIISDEVETITLDRQLDIYKWDGYNLTIKGNGVTLTRSPDADPFRLLNIEGDNTTVKISRVHFQNGFADDLAVPEGGGAIYNYGNLILESCIFSDNEIYSTGSGGSAVASAGNLTIYGCTFYRNQFDFYYPCSVVENHNRNVTLIGNLFFGNSGYSGPFAIFSGSDGVGDFRYNVVDASKSFSGWIVAGEDTNTYEVTELPFSPATFRLFPNSAVTENAFDPNMLEGEYPTVDFYGSPIPLYNALAGAVQEMTTENGLYLDLSVNDTDRGSVSVISPVPNNDSIYPAGTITIKANPLSDCTFAYWLIYMEKGWIQADNPEDTFTFEFPEQTSRVQAVFNGTLIVNDPDDTDGSSEYTKGTLRHAVAKAIDGDTISLNLPSTSKKIIMVSRQLDIDKNLTIEGNGVTITCVTPVRLMQIYGSTVKVSRVHFTGGDLMEYDPRYAPLDVGGGAIFNNGGYLTLESCIISNNTSQYPNRGGAIFNKKDDDNGGELVISGCTFYQNSNGSGRASTGRAIYNYDGSVILRGNLFYEDIDPGASSFPVCRSELSGGSIISEGYNVINAGSGTGQDGNISGWLFDSTDKTITALPMQEETFKPYSGGRADGVITALLPGYPTEDFYGDTIIYPAAAGAVQEAVTPITDGYSLSIIYDSGRGSVDPSAGDLYAPDTQVTITAAALAGYEFVEWQISGANPRTETENPLELTMTESITVEAVFRQVFIVEDFADTAAEGTLRYALDYAKDGDIIRFGNSTAPVIPGVTTILLNSELSINCGVSLEGNGITLTRNLENQQRIRLMKITGENTVVKISRVHFRGGYGDDGDSGPGGAINNSQAKLILESCIFTDNSMLTSGGSGGAIYNSGTLFVYGCTFYANTIPWGYGGAISHTSTDKTVTLAGNLFYANTAGSGWPVVFSSSTWNITSSGYNVVDKLPGIEPNQPQTQCGWIFAPTDKTITQLPVSPESLKLLKDSPAAKVITTPPADYPVVDFYGASIPSYDAAAGAVQGAVEEYGVTFSSSGGSAVAPVTVPAGDKLNKPDDPVRYDFFFDGWYKDTDLTEEWDFENGTVSGSITLYARWDVESEVIVIEINNEDDLRKIGNPAYDDYPLDGNYVLMEDITLPSTVVLCDTETNSFKGVLDGNGKTITLGTLGDFDNIGLFGVIGETGIVRNLTISGTINNMSHSTDTFYVGSVAGWNYGTIENVISDVTITVSSSGSDNCIGGIAGVNSATITNCSSYGNVTGMTTTDYENLYSGGISGRNMGAITNCFNAGNVEGSAVVNQGYGYAGGIVGRNDQGTIMNCYSTGSVTGKTTEVDLQVGFAYAGGIVGEVNKGSVSFCWASGAISVSGVTDTSINAGGIIGVISGPDDSVVSSCVALNEGLYTSSTDTESVGRIVGGLPVGTIPNLSNNYGKSGMTVMVNGTPGPVTLPVGTPKNGGDFESWIVAGWECHANKADAEAAIMADADAFPWWFPDTGDNPRLWFVE